MQEYATVAFIDFKKGDKEVIVAAPCVCPTG